MGRGALGRGALGRGGLGFLLGVALSDCGGRAVRDDLVAGEPARATGGSLSAATGGAVDSGGRSAAGGGHGGASGGASGADRDAGTTGGVGAAAGSSMGASGNDAASGGSDIGWGGAGGEELPARRPGTPPSCEGFSGNECAGGDCCVSLLVPGGRAARIRGGAKFEIPDFYLDKYEVTVGRFRRYMEAVDEWAKAGNPREGDGAHPLAEDSGWKSAWLDVDSNPSTEIDLTPPWTGSEPGAPAVYLLEGTDNLPVNRVLFHVAFAFCIWDGGRLPIQAEWLHASQGGEQNLAYPWGNEPDIAAMVPELPAPAFPLPDGFDDEGYWNYASIPVGSHPASAGIFGHEDLVTGLGEFVRDSSENNAQDQTLVNTERDLVSPFPGFEGEFRVAVWSSWEALFREPTVVPRGPSPSWGMTGGIGAGYTGFRCARDPEP